MIIKRSAAFEWSVKHILLEGLNPLKGTNITLSSGVDQDT